MDERSEGIVRRERDVSQNLEVWIASETDPKPIAAARLLDRGSLKIFLRDSIKKSSIWSLLSPFVLRSRPSLGRSGGSNYRNRRCAASFTSCS